MIHISNIRYSNGIYEVKDSNHLKSRKYKVQLISNPSYHTHVRSLKEAIDLANYAKYQEIPRRAKVDYLESLYRIAYKKSYRLQIAKLINLPKITKR